MQDDLHDLTGVLKTADEQTLAEIVRQAEKFLDSQLAAGVAADQRAVTFASVLAAIIAVLLGGYAGGAGVLGVVIMPVLFGLVVAIILAVVACRPTDWTYPGNNPRHWRSDVANSVPFAKAQAGQAQLYARGIVKNRKILERNSALMIWAMGIAVAAIGGGVVMAAIVSSVTPPVPTA